MSRISASLLISALLWAACGSEGPQPGKAQRDDALALGKPSDAGSSREDYLIVHDPYALSYNSSLGSANWVAWHLSSAWRGDAERQDNFQADPELPFDFYQPAADAFFGSGFDRGHLCPSEDRDRNAEENTATFYMTNMIPQAPNNNRETWVDFENYCRRLADEGYELYIVAGPLGQGGSGSNGGTTRTLDGGRVRVPAFVWKVALLIPNGKKDPERVDEDSRLIAVKMPNRQSVNAKPWYEYRVSADEIESESGLDFFSRLPDDIEDALESQVDDGPVN
jgi:endonuclease G